MRPHTWQALEIWEAWRSRQSLPFPGSYGQQPAWVAQIIETADNAQRVEEKRQRKTETERARAREAEDARR